MQRELYKTKNTDKNKDLVNVIKNGSVDLENKIKEMSENKIENERLYDIMNTVGDILYINNENQEGQGLKILTPDQMLSRLPISSAHLKAGNNEIYEIRQLLYSLYRSNKLTKTVCKYYLKMVTIFMNTENSKTESK